MAYQSHGGRREYMKKGIHPEYMDTEVTCQCGNKFTVRSNKKTLHIEVCDKCHPFYTGQNAKTRKTGAVEKFNNKYNLNK